MVPSGPGGTALAGAGAAAGSALALFTGGTGGTGGRGTYAAGAGAAVLPIGEQAPWVDDLPQAARPGKDGRPPATARGAGPLSPAARGRVAGPAVGVAAITPRHRPGNAFAIPTTDPTTPAAVLAAGGGGGGVGGGGAAGAGDIAPLTPGRTPGTPKTLASGGGGGGGGGTPGSVGDKTSRGGGYAAALTTAPLAQIFAVSDRLAKIGPSPHRPSATTGTAVAALTERSVTANMIRPPPGVGGAVVGFGYTTARYTPGRKKNKLTARGGDGGGDKTPERGEFRGGGEGMPEWLTRRGVDVEGGGGGTARVLTARGTTAAAATPGRGGRGVGGDVHVAAAAAAAAGTLGYKATKPGQPPTAATSSTAAPHDPETAAAEAALLALDGPDVLLVAARSALRASAISALARMLGCDWGDGSVAAVSGQAKHAVLERLVQLRVSAELRAVCADAAESGEVGGGMCIHTTHILFKFKSL